jgi:hypothetical protein
MDFLRQAGAVPKKGVTGHDTTRICQDCIDLMGDCSYGRRSLAPLSPVRASHPG